MINKTIFTMWVLAMCGAILEGMWLVQMPSSAGPAPVHRHPMYVIYRNGVVSYSLKLAEFDDAISGQHVIVLEAKP